MANREINCFGCHDIRQGEKSWRHSDDDRRSKGLDEQPCTHAQDSAGEGEESLEPVERSHHEEELPLGNAFHEARKV